MHKRAEYIWLDGATPTQQLRSKTRIFELPQDGKVTLNHFPTWNYDGSSTFQSSGGDSDLTLTPVNFRPDPIRGEGNYLVLCEVFNGDGTPHSTNNRALLRKALDNGAQEHEPWFGFEQEYTLFQGRGPLGWPDGGYPGPQGPFYCGVGTNQVYGRDLVEAHTEACMEAGIMIYGTNAEVMPGQWEYQIGHRGFSGENSGPLNVSDHLWISRWLLHRLGEELDISVSLDPKPIKGDWNGAGAHTNFSTAAMRNPETGMATIEQAIMNLGESHDRHIEHYGADLSNRLTGLHETCSIDTFRHGVADRGASIRIPRHVSEKGHGYIEDRRPGANCDPYVVSRQLLETVCMDKLESVALQN